MNLELDTKQEIILDEIKQSEEKILEISILGEFETAKAYKARLEAIKNRVSLYYSKNSIPGLSYEEASIIKDLTYLEYDIKIFFIEKGNALKQKQEIDEYKKKTLSILRNLDIHNLTNPDLWYMLTFKRDIQFIQIHNEASNNEYYLPTKTSVPTRANLPEGNRLSEQTGLTEKSLSIILSDIMTRLYLRLTRKIHTEKMQNLYMD